MSLWSSPLSGQLSDHTRWTSLPWAMPLEWDLWPACTVPTHLHLDLNGALHIGSNLGIKFKNYFFPSSIPRQHSSLTYLPVLLAPLLPCLFRAICLSENTLGGFSRTKLFIYRLWSQTVLALGFDSATYIVCLIASPLPSLSMSFSSVRPEYKYLPSKVIRTLKYYMQSTSHRIRHISDGQNIKSIMVICIK